jgi:hypothetical protein
MNISFLIEPIDHQLEDVKDSAIWLTKGNMKPRD